MSYVARRVYTYSSTTVLLERKVTYRTLVESDVFRFNRNHRRAAPMAGSVRNRVLVPFHFGPQELSDDGITHMRV